MKFDRFWIDFNISSICHQEWMAVAQRWLPLNRKVRGLILSPADHVPNCPWAALTLNCLHWLCQQCVNGIS